MNLDGQTLGPFIGIAIAAVVMLFRMRGGKAQPLRTTTMWILPILLVIMFLGLTYASRLSLMGYGWVILALAAGSALGWQRGKLMPIHLDPDTGKPMVKTSPAALIFILGLVVVRLGLRSVFQDQAANLHIDPMLITDAFMAFAVGFLAVARIEMFIRARRLVEAKAGEGRIVS